LTLQGIGESDRPAAGVQSTGVQLFDVLAMRLSRGFDVLRQHGDAVFLALTIPHNDVMRGKIQVCDTETQPLEQTQPGTVASGAHDPGDTRALAQHLGNLVLGEDHWATLRLLGPHNVVPPADVVRASLLRQQQDGAEGLALRGGRPVPCDGQMRQAWLDVLQAHIARMTLAVQQHEAFDPTQRGVVGAYALVPGPHHFADVFQECGGLSLHQRALLVETLEEAAFYAVHMCSIAETKAPGQGADGSIGLKPNFLFDDTRPSNPKD
jgi:hypothetical protein